MITMDRALSDKERGLGNYDVEIDEVMKNILQRRVMGMCVVR